MAMPRVVVVAMPCNEVVDVGGILDIFYAVNSHTGASDAGYAVEVVSPVETRFGGPISHQLHCGSGTACRS